MTQVKEMNKDMDKDNKDMTNQELNRALAELMEWKVSGQFYVNSAGENVHIVVNWHPCTATAASLEVQTAAIAKDPEKYIRNMSIVQCGPDPKVHEMVGVDLKGAARIANAKPRERAEAAYITLQGAT